MALIILLCVIFLIWRGVTRLSDSFSEDSRKTQDSKPKQTLPSELEKTNSPSRKDSDTIDSREGTHEKPKEANPAPRDDFRKDADSKSKQTPLSGLEDTNSFQRKNSDASKNANRVKSPAPETSRVKAVPKGVVAVISLGVFLAKISNEEPKKQVVIDQVNAWACKYDRCAMIHTTKDAGKIFTVGGNALEDRETQCCGTLSRLAKTSDTRQRSFDFFLEILDAGASVSGRELSSFLRITRAVGLDDFMRARDVANDRLLLKLSSDAMEEHALSLLGFDNVSSDDARVELNKMMRIEFAKKNKSKYGSKENLLADKRCQIIAAAKKKLG